jgi:predicted nucleic acid-binding protein
VYDSLYAVVARPHAGGLLTRDRRLVKLLREMDILVIEVA